MRRGDLGASGELPPLQTATMRAYWSSMKLDEADEGRETNLSRLDDPRTRLTEQHNGGASTWGHKGLGYQGGSTRRSGFGDFVSRGLLCRRGSGRSLAAASVFQMSATADAKPASDSGRIITASVANSSLGSAASHTTPHATDTFHSTRGGDMQAVAPKMERVGCEIRKS